jgi:hypothetical protein
MRQPIKKTGKRPVKKVSKNRSTTNDIPLNILQEIASHITGIRDMASFARVSKTAYDAVKYAPKSDEFVLRQLGRFVDRIEDRDMYNILLGNADRSTFTHYSQAVNLQKGIFQSKKLPKKVLKVYKDKYKTIIDDFVKYYESNGPVFSDSSKKRSKRPVSKQSISKNK